MKKGKIIVVGGAGFIGSHLVDALVAREYDVHVIDNFSRGKRDNLNPSATLHELDIRNLEAIKPVFSEAQAVFHLAALARVGYSIEYPLETHDVNVNGTLNVLIAARDAKVSRFVYSASSSAYGDQPVMPLVETMAANPQSPYGLHKYIGEQYSRVFSEVFGLPTVSLRYFSVYGPRFNNEGAYSLVIGKFFSCLKEGKPMPVTGDGSNVRDYTHVRDVVRANILAMESDAVGMGEVFNIGAGHGYSVNELTRMIGGSVEYIPERLEPKKTLADNRKARELLGWVPEISLPDGIEELKKLYLA